jgi:hypothetical protein
VIDQCDLTQRSALASDVYAGSAKLLLLGYFGHDAESNRWRNRTYFGLLILFAGLAVKAALAGHVTAAVLDLIMTASIGGTFAFVNLMMWKYLRGLDELHGRIMLDGIAFAYYVTLPVALAGCFLVKFGLLSAFALFAWILVTHTVSEGVGRLLAARKYR